jgi:hypothetical protein
MLADAAIALGFDRAHSVLRALRCVVVDNEKKSELATCNKTRNTKHKIFIFIIKK